MANSSECLQIILGKPTPCFTALGGKPCNAASCLVADHLQAKGIAYPTTDRMEKMSITHALHNVCPQTIHNPNLSPEEIETLMAGLKASLNR